MALSHTFTNTAAPGEASAAYFVAPGGVADFTAIGTIDAGVVVVLEISTDNTWREARRWTAGSVNASGRVEAPAASAAHFRFRADVPTTDPATVLTSFAVTMTAAARTIQEWTGSDGTRVLSITDDGISAPSVATDTIAEKTAAAGVTIDSVKLKDGEATVAAAGAVYFGDSGTNGSWRFVRAGDNLVIQRRETGTWSTKSTIAAA